jgi:hypothetical protein
MPMDREHFENLMLPEKKIFSGYAGVFMDSKDSQAQGFLDWCWRKYLEGEQPSPDSTELDVDFYSGGPSCFLGNPIIKKL